MANDSTQSRRDWLPTRRPDGPIGFSEDDGSLRFYTRQQGAVDIGGIYFGPKRADHPTLGALCPACEREFGVGDLTVLISLGPGAKAERRERCRAGRRYSAVAVEVHLACATGVRP